MIVIIILLGEKIQHDYPGKVREQIQVQVLGCRRYNMIFDHPARDPESGCAGEPGHLEKVSLSSLQACQDCSARLHGSLPGGLQGAPPQVHGWTPVITCTLPRDGEEMRDPFGERRGKFQWSKLLERLQAVRETNPAWFLLVG